MIIDTFDRLNDKFRIKERFSTQQYLDEYFFRSDRHMMLIDGSHELSRDLILDWGRLEDLISEKSQKLFGLVVLGDLAINGSMLNTNRDGGPVLLVEGNVVAHNLLAGGADIIVNQDANIREVILADYNHGFLTISKEAHAAVFIVHDHCYDVRDVHARFESVDRSELRCVDDYDDDDPDLEEDVERWSRLNQLLTHPIADLEELRKDLEAGRCVVKKDAWSSHRSPPFWAPQSKEEVRAFLKQNAYLIAKDIPTSLQADREFMLELADKHKDVYRFLPNGWHLDPMFMEAAVRVGSRSVVSYVKFIKDEQQRDRLSRLISEKGLKGEYENDDDD